MHLRETYLSVCDVRRQSSSTGNLEALDNSCFAATVISHNDGEGFEESDRLGFKGRECSDSLNRHLPNFRHLEKFVFGGYFRNGCIFSRWDDDCNNKQVMIC